MELFDLYWMLILPRIGALFFLLSLAPALLAMFWVFNLVIEQRLIEWLMDHSATAFGVFMYLSFTASVATLIPDRETMMYLIGGYAVTNVDNIESLPPNIVNAANKFLEDYSKK